MDNCGILFWPQLLLSIVVVALIVGYFSAWRRKEIPPGHKPWQESIDPLASLAVGIGLFGSIVGFIAAFSGFQHGVDIGALARGLSLAYWTTGVGLVTSLVASTGSYLLNLLSRRN